MAPGKNCNHAQAKTEQTRENQKIQENLRKLEKTEKTREKQDIKTKHEKMGELLKTVQLSFREHVRNHCSSVLAGHWALEITARAASGY